MARKKNTTIEDLDETPEQVAPEQVAPETDAADLSLDLSELSPAERIAEIKARGEIDEITSRVYEITSKGREYLDKVADVVEEDFLAENYGAGKYYVAYSYKKNGVRNQTTQIFNISEKRGAPASVAGVQNAKTDVLGAFLGGLTPERITGIVAAVQGLKTLFAPPPSPVDVTELIKALAAPRAPSVGDAVLIKALEGVNRANNPPAPSILTQIKELNEVKELLGADERAGGNDTMDKFISMGLQMLPALLQKNGGNYQAAGASVRENPMIAMLIEKDPALLGDFCAAVKEKFGEQAARDLAAGYGYQMENEPAQKQIENQQAAPQAAGV